MSGPTEQCASSPERRLAFVGDYLPDTQFCCVGEWRNDVIIANLEAVVLESRPTLRSKAYSVALGPESYRHIATSGVSAFNLANNHVYDAGEGAFLAMLAELMKIPGIQMYGLRSYPFAKLKVGALSCAVIGCLERCRARGPELFREEDVTSLIGDLKSRYDRVYVTPHWGKESELALHPGPHQRALARQWIDAGASGIFGHHSHTIQGFERFREAPIVYSLGNYQFDHEEGRAYPAASWGLVARVNPADHDESVSFEFLLQRGGEVIPVVGEDAGLLRTHFDRISADLSTVSGTSVTWSRSVGPVYMSKCRASWRLRLKSAPLRTAMLWAAWNLLPRTLLLRFGSLAPDRHTVAYRDHLNVLLQRLQSRLTSRTR
jgi:hypothetical protein